MWRMCSSLLLLHFTASVLKPFTRSHRIDSSGQIDLINASTARRIGSGSVPQTWTTWASSESVVHPVVHTEVGIRAEPLVLWGFLGVGFPSPEPKVTGSTPVGHTVGNPIGRSCFGLLPFVRTTSQNNASKPRPTRSTRRAAVAGTFGTMRTASDGKSPTWRIRRSSTATRSSTLPTPIRPFRGTGTARSTRRRSHRTSPTATLGSLWGSSGTDAAAGRDEAQDLRFIRVEGGKWERRLDVVELAELCEVYGCDLIRLLREVGVVDGLG